MDDGRELPTGGAKSIGQYELGGGGSGLAVQRRAVEHGDVQLQCDGTGDRGQPCVPVADDAGRDGIRSADTSGDRGGDCQFRFGRVWRADCSWHDVGGAGLPGERHVYEHGKHSVANGHGLSAGSATTGWKHQFWSGDGSSAGRGESGFDRDVCVHSNGSVGSRWFRLELADAAGGCVLRGLFSGGNRDGAAAGGQCCRRHAASGCGDDHRASLHGNSGDDQHGHHNVAKRRRLRAGGAESREQSRLGNPAGGPAVGG